MNRITIRVYVESSAQLSQLSNCEPYATETETRPCPAMASLFHHGGGILEVEYRIVQVMHMHMD